MDSFSTRVSRLWITIKAGLRLGDSKAGAGTGATLSERFVHGSFWSLAGAVGSQGFTLVASMFAARLLGRDAFGQFSFLQGSVTTAATFAGFGLGLTATRYVSDYRRNDAARAGTLVRFILSATTAAAALVSGFAVVAAPYLASHLFHLPALSASIRWAALYLFCMAINGVQTGVLAGFESFRAIAVVNVTRGVATLLLTIPMVWIWHIEGAVAAGAIAGVAVFAMSLFQVAKAFETNGIPKPRGFDLSHVRLLWTFSLPSVMASILVSPVTWLASLWLSRQPHGYSELGLFGAANQWRNAVTFFPTLLAQPMLPLLTTLVGGQSRSFKRLVSFSILLNGGVAVAAGIAVVFAIPLISMLYGKSFADLHSVLLPMLVAAVISCAAAPIGEALASEEQMWTGLALNLIWACCLLAIAHVIIPSLGARGLAYSFLGAYCLHFFTTGGYVYFRSIRKRSSAVVPQIAMKCLENDSVS